LDCPDRFVLDEDRPLRRLDCELGLERADRRSEPEPLRFEPELPAFLLEFPDLAPEFPCAICSPSRKRRSGRSIRAVLPRARADGFYSRAVPDSGPAHLALFRPYRS
jgi:hypothetical protein